MKSWLLALALGLPTGAALAVTPVPDALRRQGEKTVFAFITRSGKTASLCEGPKGAYLVYRFGTAAKVELQYPAVLDASSWRKFTYWNYHRGGGLANAGMEFGQLSFQNGGAEYLLMDETDAVLNKAKKEDYQRQVYVEVTINNRHVTIDGQAATASGNLYLSDEQRQRVRPHDE